MHFQRVTIIVLALVSLLVTTLFESILAMALYAYTMVGAAVTPALLAAFLWKRVPPAGGVASVGLGMVSTIVFGSLANAGVTSLNLGFVAIPLNYDYIIYPAATLSILGLVVVSLLTTPSPEEKWKLFVAN